MLPNIRAVLAAVAAAMGLLTLSFALVAAFRVAQDRSSPLQAELAQRNRMMVAFAHEPARPAPIADTAVIIPAAIDDAPAQAVPPRPIEVAMAAVPEIEEPAEPAAAEIAPALSLAALAPPQSPALISPPEPPIGGPLSDRIATVAPPDHAAAARAARIAKAKAAKIAAAKKARIARLARERRAAARRAALARAAREPQADAFNAQGQKPPLTGTFTSSF